MVDRLRRFIHSGSGLVSGGGLVPGSSSTCYGCRNAPPPSDRRSVPLDHCRRCCRCPGSHSSIYPLISPASQMASHPTTATKCEGPTWSPHVSGIQPTGFREWVEKMRAIVLGRKNEVLFSSKKTFTKKIKQSSKVKKRTDYSANQPRVA